MEEFREIVERCARPSLAMTQRERTDCITVAASFVKHGTEQLKRTVQHAGRYDLPLMRVFQSDGWGCKLASVDSFYINGRNVRRHGFTQTEYLVEVTLMKTIDATLEIEMILPIPHFTRIADKSGWTIFQSAARRAPILGGGDWLGRHCDQYISAGRFACDGIPSATARPPLPLPLEYLRRA